MNGKQAKMIRKLGWGEDKIAAWKNLSAEDKGELRILYKEARRIQRSTKGRTK